MKIIQTIAIGFVFLLSSCVTDSYNVGDTTKTKDVNENNEYVYGDGKGKPARQTKNTYADPADAQQRADKVLEKMFGKAESLETGAAKTDTTKKDEKKTEKKEEVKKEEKK